MSQPYNGEIRMFAGNFAPAGWMFCDGQILPISEFAVLFTLIGTTYGGDGQQTFALPDLRGRLPIHQGSGFTLAQNGGVETVTVTVQQLPVHTHPMVASTGGGNVNTPKNNVTAASPSVTLYIQDAVDSPWAVGAVSPAGGSQPHDNLQPYLAINFIISLFGIFPSQT